MNRNIILIALLCLLPMGRTVAQSVTVEAKIDSLQILIGEQAKVQLQVAMDAKQRAVFPAYTDTLVRGVEIIETVKPDTQFLNDRQRMLITQEYIITSFDSALYYLPPMPVTVDGKEYRSKALALKVYSMPVDTLHPDQFFGQKTVMKAPFAWEDWYGLIGCSFLALPLLGLLIYLIIRIRDNKPIIRKIKVEPKLPPHQAAMKEIERIKSEKVWQKGEPKTYYTELTDTLRTYIKDRFGFVWESNEVTYESMIPEAVPELTLGNTVDVVGEVGDEMGQAPLEVEFDASGSKNASSYEWYLYKDTTDLVGMVLSPEDSLIGNQIRTQEDFVYTYEHSGRYKVMLVAIHGKGNFCRDTSDIQYVNVVESLLDVPNVFTPNGDGKNDIFKVKALSLESFQGVILNRWGRKIYEWNDPSEGWDGRIGGKYASPGTYFYVITAKGREKVNPPKYVKKGALLLVR